MYLIHTVTYVSIFHCRLCFLLIFQMNCCMVDQDSYGLAHSYIRILVMRQLLPLKWYVLISSSLFFCGRGRGADEQHVLFVARSGLFFPMVSCNFCVVQRAVVNHIINSGRLSKGRCPLMYEWHGKKYWGAAHGLAGIMHVLMDMELSADQKESVRGTLQYMMKNRFRSGNYPSSEGNESDRLVHWCHGAPGVALTLVRAAKVRLEVSFLFCSGLQFIAEETNINEK